MEQSIEPNFITIYTIGFTKKNAKSFFELLKNNKVVKVVDTRLKNESQLAGFSKKDDLNYFLRTILNVDYVHKPELAPTEEMLTAYKKKKLNWQDYEERYIKLISDRKVENLMRPVELNNSCLLCSEAEPHHCHRRLLAEYLQKKWSNVIIKHI